MPVSEFFDNFDEIAPDILFYQDVNEEQKLTITKRIREYYFRDHEDINALNNVSFEYYGLYSFNETSSADFR